MTKEFYILTAWIDDDTPVFLTTILFDDNDEENMLFLWTSDMDDPDITCFDNPDVVYDIISDNSLNSNFISDIQDTEYDVYQSYTVGIRTFEKPYH